MMLMAAPPPPSSATPFGGAGDVDHLDDGDDGDDATFARSAMAQLAYYEKMVREAPPLLQLLRRSQGPGDFASFRASHAKAWLLCLDDDTGTSMERLGRCVGEAVNMHAPHDGAAIARRHLQCIGGTTADDFLKVRDDALWACQHLRLLNDGLALCALVRGVTHVLARMNYHERDIALRVLLVHLDIGAHDEPSRPSVVTGARCLRAWSAAADAENPVMVEFARIVIDSALRTEQTSSSHELLCDDLGATSLGARTCPDIVWRIAQMAGRSPLYTFYRQTGLSASRNGAIALAVECLLECGGDPNEAARELTRIALRAHHMARRAAAVHAVAAGDRPRGASRRKRRRDDDDATTTSPARTRGGEDDAPCEGGVLVVCNTRQWLELRRTRHAWLPEGRTMRFMRDDPLALHAAWYDDVVVVHPRLLDRLPDHVEFRDVFYCAAALESRQHHRRAPAQRHWLVHDSVAALVAVQHRYFSMYEGRFLGTRRPRLAQLYRHVHVVA